MALRRSVAGRALEGLVLNVGVSYVYHKRRSNSCDARAVAVRVKILNFALCETHYQLKNMQPTIAHSRAASVSELSQARVGGGGNRYVGW